MHTTTPSLKISRILHAGYIFESSGVQIAFDPIFENPFSHNCYAFPNVKFDREQIQKLKLSAVFISHYHDDHCSLESLQLLDRSTPIYIYCVFEELFALVRSLGFLHVHSLTIDKPVFVGPIEVIPRRALDEDVDSLFQIKAAGLNILNVVDSWIDEDTLALLLKNAPWDMILWPFQTMREIEVLSPQHSTSAPANLPAEWLEQLKTLNPRYIVPSSCQFLQESWSWYNTAFFPISYKQFQIQVEAALPKAKVHRLNPGTSIVLTAENLALSQSLSFVETVGDQDLDYQYNPKTVPPATSEIAKNFAALTPAQIKTIENYCREGLIKKYQSLEHDADSYFKTAKLWRLSLYDHTGSAFTWTYRLADDQITLVDNTTTELISWFTEVPMTKLYGAVVFGETLTSMYIRINDTVFDPEIEKEILETDITLDPLIRCLFDGVFGAYQKTQWERITSQKWVSKSSPPL